MNNSNGLEYTDEIFPMYTDSFNTISSIFPAASMTVTISLAYQTPVTTTTSSSDYFQESTFVYSYSNIQPADEISIWSSELILSTITIGSDTFTTTADILSNTDQSSIYDSRTSSLPKSNSYLTSSSTTTFDTKLLTTNNYVSSLTTTNIPTTSTSSLSSSSSTLNFNLNSQTSLSSQISTSRSFNIGISSSFVESSIFQKTILPPTIVTSTTSPVSMSTSESLSYKKSTELSPSTLHSFPTSTISTSAGLIFPNTISKYPTHIASSIVIPTSASSSSSSSSTSSVIISTPPESVSTPLIVISSLSVATLPPPSSIIVSPYSTIPITTSSTAPPIPSSKEQVGSDNVQTQSTSFPPNTISVVTSQPLLTETTTSFSTPTAYSSALFISQSPTSTSSSKNVVTFDPFATYTTTTTISFSGLSLFEHTTASSTSLTSTIISVHSSSKASTAISTTTSSTSFSISSIISPQQPISVTSTSVISSTTSTSPKFTSSTTISVLVISSKISVGNNISTTVLIGSTKHVSVSTTLNQTPAATASSKTIISMTRASVLMSTGTITASTTTSYSYSTNNPNWWVPTEIITDSGNSTLVTETNYASQTANLPKMITSSDTNEEPAEGYTLITIGFKKALNYQFVISNPQSSVQIISFLPEVLNNPFNNNLTDIVVSRLVPLQDNSIPYLVTVAKCYFPESLISSLSSMLKDSSSPLYTRKASKNIINTLAQLIDPSIPITGLIYSSNNLNTSSDNDSATSDNNNPKPPNDSDNGSNDQNNNGNNSINLNFANTGTLDGSDLDSMAYNNKNINRSDSSSTATKKKITGIVVGVVVGSAVYIVTVGFLVRHIINRYKKQSIIKHTPDETFSISSNESSINDEKYSHHSSTNHNFNGNTFLSEEFGIGINAKRGNSVKLKISKPIASQNSLGF
ncbi:hypothetical protein RI543_000343 [Arxiozyma heterogenica]|uniref:Uncharacterized protein n=1 Tax=Arxiozyma heterogenica TaxID=278026 RepID=A0AAN7W6M7_9SACH|nr:hypothetical protein RI543_000343 [Kazachstania heterogenica]